jgi:ligand-binding SRPBCC domain-containing protein
MPTIELITEIKANITICFDLSRSIDLHKISTAHTNEKAIDGRTSGLIELNEFVTWQAKHFGITQKLSSKITQFNRPFHFRDELLSGIFKSLVHDHFFEQKENYVIMKDIFVFKSPLGFIGNWADKLVLTEYLKALLINRNNVIKEYAETEKWKSVLDEKEYL